MSRPARLPRWAGNRLSVSAGLRGKGASSDIHPCYRRITPACAGKSGLDLAQVRPDGDHPRVCGEKGAIGSRNGTATGSPPRVRGKAEQKSLCFSQPGITPACAGKSIRLTSGMDRRKGSPPRVRGKVRNLSLRPALHGITPACAGKRASERAPATHAPDHPRVCGEKSMPATPWHRSPGSPPRVRGKDRSTTVTNSIDRITPACAGKSFPENCPDFEEEDHPRVCGEKRRPGRRCRRLKGSPPRVRGKVNASGIIALDVRITPACAGKSKGCAAPAAAVQDHPRVCGEKFPLLRLTRCRLGSPPRVRGKD